MSMFLTLGWENLLGGVIKVRAKDQRFFISMAVVLSWKTRSLGS
jgi:hypothetical protein